MFLLWCFFHFWNRKVDHILQFSNCNPTCFCDASSQIAHNWGNMASAGNSNMWRLSLRPLLYRFWYHMTRCYSCAYQWPRAAPAYTPQGFWQWCRSWLCRPSPGRTGGSAHWRPADSHNFRSGITATPNFASYISHQFQNYQTYLVVAYLLTYFFI